MPISFEKSFSILGYNFSILQINQKIACESGCKKLTTHGGEMNNIQKQRRAAEDAMQTHCGTSSQRFQLWVWKLVVESDGDWVLQKDGDNGKDRLKK